MKPAELKKIMTHCYGTENYYTNQHLDFKYTDGVKAFCENAMAYWLLDIVESIVKTKPAMADDLIVITLTVKKDHTAKITFKDSYTTIHTQDIPYTDCPMGEWRFYYQNEVFFWNGEY